MKDKLIAILTLIAFFGILVFGGILFTIVLLVVIPLALLRCMFSTVDRKNESL